MWAIAEGIRGLGDAARALKIPIVSGNVSLNNETKGKSILPTPMIAMVGLMEDASKALTIYFKSVGDKVLVIGDTDGEELGGSEYLAHVAGIEKGAVPILDYDKELATSKAICVLANKAVLKSCHDVSAGGLAVALAECCFNEQQPIGVSLQVEEYDGSKAGLLFSESGARYIVSCSAENEKIVRAELDKAGLAVTASGTVGGSVIEVKDFGSLDLNKAFQGWRNGLSQFF
jgi:phosphoribosylformylglycinamidine synthase